MGRLGWVVPILVAGIAAVAQDSATSRIEVAKPIPRKIRAGEIHSYTVHAEWDQYLWLSEEQRGIDLSIALQGSDGKALGDNSEFPVNGVKEIFWITAKSGDYRVTVRALDSQPAAEGRYTLELRVLRVPLPEDRKRFSAFLATAEATDLLERRRPRSAESLQQAVAKYKEALPLWQAVGERHWEAFVEHQLGAAYLTLQQLPGARDALLSALPIRRTIGDTRLLALTLSTLGAVYNDLGEYREAVKCLDEARPLRRAAGDKKGEANTLNNLAFAHVRLNEREKALDLHLQALAIRHEIDDKEGMTLALGNLSLLYRYMGQAEKALEMGVEQLAIARALGDDRRQADALSGIGGSYYLLGEIKKAQSYWLEAEPIYQRSGDVFGIASALGSLGATNARLKKYKEAADYYSRSLELRRKASNSEGEISSLLGLCYVMASTGELAKASEAGEQALGIARRTAFKLGIGRSLRCLAELDQRAGKWDQAREKLEDSAAIFRAGGDSVELSLTLAQLAAIESNADKLAEALSIAKEAQSLVESERAGLTADLRASLRASRAELYALEIDVLMRRHRADPAGGSDAQALEANERARARSLIEVVADSRIDLRDEMTAEQRSREEAIRGRISSIHRELLRAGNTKEELQGQLAAAERELELFQIELRRTTMSHYAEAQYAGALNPERIRREVLGTGTTLVEYAIGEKRSYVWALTPRGLISATLAPREEIERQVAAYRQELSQRVSVLTAASSLARLEAQSRQLYRMLLQPVEKALSGSQKLIIVTDGVLAYLPFETLRADVPLIERFAIGYAPSASARAGLRRRAGQSTDRTKTLLAVADPVYDTNSGAVERGVAFTQLPNTRSEVTAIGSLFRPVDRRVYLGADATEQQMKTQDFRSFRFVHVAAHGYVDEEQPAHSGIVLSARQGAAEDGILRVPEIMRLRLNAEIVTLSACQTGLGQVLAGEGVMGLTRAFLYAGAQSVVVSLWNVNDSATAELMKALYRNLGRGTAPEESLRQAKLSLMRGPQKTWRHPYYWAPFVFVGDASRP